MFSTARISSFVVQTVIALLVISGLVMTTILSIRYLTDQAAIGRDNYWKAEIARSEAEAARTIIEQMKLAQKEDQKAQAEIKRLRDQLDNLEKENAKLPDIFGSGIDRDRTRLLNNHSLTDRSHTN
ncbi:hypothetical protein [Paenochrobactrum glaciei]|uniref:Uncharacterized protein n=1 Tax=Paenochrobactrum glaciei TaxID=486407 RepID=A0ABN1FY42_9HYPH